MAEATEHPVQLGFPDLMDIGVPIHFDYEFKLSYSFFQAAALAASQRTLDPENQIYHVLMIVTDGVINDMGNTKDALVAAADLPFSVIM